MNDADQYSEESRLLLREETARFVAQLERYVEAVGGMHGGSHELPRLFAGNESLRRAAARWNERALDHTGTFPLLLVEPDDEEVEDEEQSDPNIAQVQGQVSIVSPWDLDVLEHEQLLAAGRAGLRRAHPHETEQDAAVAVTDAVDALHALRDEAGEPWLDVPGVEVLSAVRVYLLPDEPLEPFEVDIGSPIDGVVPPPGAVVLSESW